MKLAVGQHLDATGDGWSMPDGCDIVEADTVNGIDLAKRKKEKESEKHRPKMPKHAASHR